jgi:UDP-N-acetylmuramate: L-alanyl-gamma-D-glutamyl-meso-diaminopimelate ligase
MHSLAIALHRKGYRITGSDDEIVDPARTMLEKHGLLPESPGWFPERIHPGIDAVILGMHARIDNPELQKALDTGIRVYSYPEFLYSETAHKTRVVIGGSHGKTTITSMVMHVLKNAGYRFDYMVGSRLAGFDNMVNLERENTIAVFEGDEYLSSCLDPRPKFHLYHPQLALISGIAWDHMNVFPTIENYEDQFRIFIQAMPPEGSLVYCAEDPRLMALVESGPHPRLLPYTTPAYTVESGVAYLEAEARYPLQVFGHHNLLNLAGARILCNQLGIADRQFHEAMVSFTGAGKRLQLLGRNDHTAVYLDFAHSPSKVEATIQAVREQYPERRLVACLELHTFSSLNKIFLSQYNHTMDLADTSVVFFNPETIVHKRLEMITSGEVREAFGRDLQVFTDREALGDFLGSLPWKNSNLLLMSSGTFAGMNILKLSDNILVEHDG